MPEVAGVEDAAVVLVAEVVGATDEVAGIDDVADAEEVAVALVVLTAEDELAEVVLVVVLVVSSPFPPHPIRSAATITRVKEIPKIFFKFHPSYPAFGFPAEN